jgi:hypothetical protein
LTQVAGKPLLQNKDLSFFPTTQLLQAETDFTLPELTDFT